MTTVAADEPFELAPAELETSRRVAAAYVWTANAILLVTGALGVLLRFSQADVPGRVADNFWYATMTVHGLGAFLGWAGFAVMGFAFWVLARVGFPLRRGGLALAWLTYWLMVGGVVLVVITTLGMGFGASWVFLYPLPFHPAGQWGDWATALFLTGVLLVGLSIVTWCLSVLNTVIGPALHAVKSGIANRLGVALGFGYLWPRRFATNPRSVPYAVIPLTVIAIDMIIATLPLAGLLVQNIVQVFEPSVTVDPLLAKNILWWFGHPVVYLLLFPAVALYYYLVPRYAGRPLVAANVIAVAWTVAVIANVVVWAHHIYLDYPTGAQAVVNTIMQPTTFALVLPSALSIYSLGATMYRSNWTWTGASTALFLGIVSWLLAGLSGVINATIAADVVVHNTLWIVGHFHHMALLNIGLLIFGATYAFLPDLTGKPLYSDAMAKWHVWLTFVFGTLNSAFWLVQGLDGAPRRFSVLPNGWWEDLSKAALPVVAILAAAQLLFAWNIVQTMRGAGYRDAAERRRRRPVAAAEAAVTLLVLGLLALTFFVGYFIGRESADEGTGGAAATTAAAPGTGGGEDVQSLPGAKVFASAGCSSCHTLSAAGANGAVGPNLDGTTLSEQQIAAVVTNGRGGMPSFQGQLGEDEIAQVAAYVAAARRGG
ncbi:MAG: cbb3-type cytochrome c oxidase subunit I [Pseudomonadota bacterium]